MPEDFGGERNWDYRYCWLRDAALTLDSLVQAGYTEEADLWRDWLLRTIAGDPAQMQIMYTVDGSRRLPEVTLDHLPGYAESRPVRIGNGAVEQTQHDVLGEVMHALDRVRRAEGMPHKDAWPLQRALVAEMATRWQDPDHGLWEIRGEPQAFTHSRVMIWVAFDRAVRAMEDYDLAGPLEEWRALRDQVREEVLEKGYDAERGTFVQHYGTTEVDASLLVLPLVGFIDGDDPRMLGTIKAIEEDLLHEGLVLRYRTESGVDGLPGDEHPFVACSFWLVSAYAAAGRVDDAHALFDRLVGLRNDVGLLSEEYDPRSATHGRQLPAGVQPPRAGAGGVPPRRRRRPGCDRHQRWLRRAPCARLKPGEPGPLPARAQGFRDGCCATSSTTAVAFKPPQPPEHRAEGRERLSPLPAPGARFRSGDRERHRVLAFLDGGAAEVGHLHLVLALAELAEVELQLSVLQGLGDGLAVDLDLDLAGDLDAVVALDLDVEL